MGETYYIIKQRNEKCSGYIPSIPLSGKRSNVVNTLFLQFIWLLKIKNEVPKELFFPCLFLLKQRDRKLAHFSLLDANSSLLSGICSGGSMK